MKLTPTALRRLRGLFLLASLIAASAGAILALRLGRPSLGIACLTAAAIGLAMAIAAAALQTFIHQGAKRSFDPRRNKRFKTR